MIQQAAAVSSDPMNRDPISIVLDTIPEKERLNILAVLKKIGEGRQIGTQSDKEAFVSFVKRAVVMRRLDDDFKSSGAIKLFIDRLNPNCAKMLGHISGFLERDVLTYCINDDGRERAWARISAFLLLAYYLHIKFPEKPAVHRAYE